MIEAIILAGGQAERLGKASGDKPKALVSIGGRPLVSYQLEMLRDGGVDRVILSCAIGQQAAFESELNICGIELDFVEESEPLGRGGGLRYAAAARRSVGDLIALNGDEIFDLDIPSILDQHSRDGAAATIAVTPLVSQFGVVDFDDTNKVKGFREAPVLPFWVNCGFYVLGEEALERLPSLGDHERLTFPALAAEGKLFAYRHEGFWLTVNTPKDLRRAREYFERNSKSGVMSG